MRIRQQWKAPVNSMPPQIIEIDDDEVEKEESSGLTKKNIGRVKFQCLNPAQKVNRL